MALMCLFYMIGFLSAENQRIFHTRRSIRIDTTGIKKLIRYGAPSGMQFFLDISAITVFVFLIGQLGKAELAASNIVWAINALAFYPMLGASVATATLVGQYIGRKDLGTAEKSTYTALKAVEAYMLFFAVLYYLFPHTLMEWFHGESGAVEAPFAGIADLGSRILLFVAIYQISDAMTITFSGALRGAGDTAFAMWTGVICSWLLFVPGTWIALNWLGWGIMGAWLWATIYTTVMGVVYMLRFRSGYWKRIRLIDDDG
jgi:MATE family multidrug resistance protein